MKTLYASFVSFLFGTVLLFFVQIAHAQTTNIFPSTGSAGIGTTTPDASSLLEMRSTAKGLLIPRMTFIQRNKIVSPATGLMIFQTNSTPGFYYYNGSAWSSVTMKDTTTANRTLSNLTGPTSVNMTLIPSKNDSFNLGTPNKRWKNVNLYGLNFADNTVQSTAFVPYIAGAGISITGNKIAATGGGGGANTSLSNLSSPTAVNRDLIPSAAATNDLGTFFQNWRNGYFSGTVFSGTMQANTTGNFTAITANATDGVGISGTSTGTGNKSYGMAGYNSNNIGVYGEGGNTGVYGKSSNAFGVVGESTTAVGVYGTGGNEGVVGSCGNGEGVLGESDSSNGVAGYSTVGTGVYGQGLQGVYGETILPEASAGVIGQSTYNVGLFGISTNSYGIFARTDNPNSYAGYFLGNVYTTGNYLGSDRTLKQNIRDFSSAMNILNELHPEQYEFRQDGNYKLMNLPAGSHYGLIAQDVEKILPDLVKESKFDPATAMPPRPGAKKIRADSTKADIINFKALNYTELIPIMIKGMQELSKENDAKDSLINSLQNSVEELKQMVQSMTGKNAGLSSNNISLSSASLDQNIPNPFKGSTIISYVLPEKYNTAQIIIRNNSGHTLKTITVTGKGKGSLNVDASTIASGAYTYSLLIDGKLIDTKQMILVK